MPNDPQVPWTDEQWARVNQVIQEEASRARVAATFLPLVGPLPADTDFVRAGDITYPAQRIVIDDKSVIQLATLQVKVYVRSAQMADPEMTSVLALFRRAANVIARLEDAVVFNGLAPHPDVPDRFVPPQAGIAGLQAIWEITGGQVSPGLLAPPGARMVPVRGGPAAVAGGPAPLTLGDRLVPTVSEVIGRLERSGHFGPFAVALGHVYFTAVQTPSPALVLPQDRIIPFLGGGPLLRSSTLPDNRGVVVALGGAPVELVVAKDISLQFLQLTDAPNFLFRVSEKIALRIKEADAIATLV
jgi:uncharacterized linocin/CFP29 family protein